MAYRGAQRDAQPTEESDYSDENEQYEDEDEQYSDENYDDESSGEEEEERDEDHEEESRLAEILCESLDHLKEEYDQLVQQKLQELERKKNVEIRQFREQEEIFKTELQTLRKERQETAQIIRDLQAQLTAQRVEFDRNLGDLREPLAVESKTSMDLGLATPNSSLVPPISEISQEVGSWPGQPSSSKAITHPITTTTSRYSPPIVPVPKNEFGISSAVADPLVYKKNPGHSSRAVEQGINLAPSRDEKAKGMLRKLLDPLATAIIRGVIEQRDLFLYIEKRKDDVRALGKQIKGFYYYCIGCNGRSCKLRLSGEDMCRDCKHHFENHHCTPPDAYEKEIEYAGQIELYNQEINLMSEVLAYTEKEHNLITHACLVFCYYLSYFSSHYFASRQLPYYDELRNALNHGYKEQIKKMSEYDKTTALCSGIEDFHKHFGAKLKEWDRSSFRLDVEAVENEIVALTKLEVRKELSDAISDLFKTDGPNY